MSRLLLAIFLVSSPSWCQIGPAPDLGTSRAPEQTLTGRVIDGGTPVPGATVHLAWRRYPLANGTSTLATHIVRRKATAGPDGRFSAGIPPWRWCSVWATHGGKVSAIVDEVRSPAAPVELALQTAAKVSGRLRFEQAAPESEIAFRLVRVTTKKNALPLRFEGKTDAEGSFEVGGLPAGPWLLMLRAGEFRLPRPVVLDAPGEATQVALARGITLTCRLVSKDDRKPIAGAAVELLDTSHYCETETDDSGTFQLAGVDDGPGAAVLVRSASHERRILVLEPGLSPRQPAPQATLAVPKGGRAFGRVLDDQGAPAAGLDVLMRCDVHISGVTSHDLSVLVKTDAEGKFETNLLEKNALYSAIALPPSGEAQQFGSIDPRPQLHEPDLGTFRLGSRRVETTVRTPGGEATFEARLYGPRRSGDYDSFHPMLPTGKGTWISPCLQPGEYAAVATSSERGLAREDVTMEKMESGRLTKESRLTLLPARTIEGQVVDPAGEPRANATVFLLPAGADETGGSQRWTDIVLYNVLKARYEKDQWPPRVTSKADGTFSIVCYEASGDWDLVGKSGAPTEGPGPEGAGVTRIEHVLRLKGPQRLVVR